MKSRFSTWRFLSLFTLILTITLVTSCEDNDQLKESGKVSFGFTASSSSDNGRVASPDAAFLLVTIADGSGNIVHEKKKIELFTFGSEFLSEPIDLHSGHYSLTEFFVLNSANEIIYATPLEGSKLAHLVNDPLPIAFEILKDQTGKVTPQVLSIEEFNHAEDFGYTTFSFDIVEALSFQLGVFIHDEGTQNFELTESHVTVTDADSSIVLFDNVLSAITNRVAVKKGYDYKLTVAKEGYQSFTAIYTEHELSAYSSDSVLIVKLWPSDSSHTIPTDGLVAEYLFNGNANDSRNNLHGTVTGATLTTDRHGKANAAYSFDGDYDYILVPDNDLIDFGYDEDFTISVWADISGQQATSSGINDIIRKWVGDTQGYPYCIAYLDEDASHHQNTIVTVRQDGLFCGHAAESFTPVVETDKFIHIVYQKKGDKLIVYIDGIVVNEIIDTNVPSGSCTPENDAPMSIGARGQLVTFFTGKIDDIRIYNRAVTSEEVQALLHE
ncbi:MAG TPA: LamG domain-containing protein [Ohtaekwangia sp.]